MSEVSPIRLKKMKDHKSALGIDETTTALFGYLIPLVALIVLLVDKRNKFVRFHAVQSLLFAASSIAFFVVYSALTGLVIFAAMSSMSELLASFSSLLTLLSPVWVLAWFALLFFTAYKGYNGHIWKLPVIGNLAEKWSGSSNRTPA